VKSKALGHLERARFAEAQCGRDVEARPPPAESVMTDQPASYADLKSVLEELVTSVRVALSDAFIGMYLQGSFAVGDFDQHSDVDFIVVVRDELSDDEVAALQLLHDRVYGLASTWAQHLEGSYFPAAILRSPECCGTPLWFLDHGSRSLVRSDHCNTLVVRSVLRHFGITLAGPAPRALIDPIATDALRREMHETIHTWGREILEDPDLFRNRFYQGFIVLNYARMLHDLVAGRPGSKRAGAEWAKTNLDVEWSGLIDRAWNGRPNPAVSVREPADAADYQRTLEFVKLVMSRSSKALEA
jgi:hypothetical protein